MKTNFQIQNSIYENQAIVCMPDRAKEIGIVKVGRFEHKTVYLQNDPLFTGTEIDFLREGFAYAYRVVGSQRQDVTKKVVEGLII